MKKTILLLVAFKLCGFSYAQSTITELPSFYDNSDESNTIFSVDIESYIDIDPVVLYKQRNVKGVYCKTYNGENWIDFGKFPTIESVGHVNLEFYKTDAYALVQTGDYFSMYKKGFEDENWKLFGNKNFASTDKLAYPILTFTIKGEPLIYEKHYSKDEVSMYKYQDGKFYYLELSAQLKGIGNDLVIANDKTKPHKMIMAWTNFTEGNHIIEVDAEGEVSTQKEITKGLKIKKLKQINILTYYKKQLYIVCSEKEVGRTLSKWDDLAEKWISIKIYPISKDQIGFTPCDDLSYITYSRETQIPMFHKFNGTNWNKGVSLGNIKTAMYETKGLIKVFNSYYHQFIDSKGKSRIFKIN